MKRFLFPVLLVGILCSVTFALANTGYDSGMGLLGTVQKSGEQVGQKQRRTAKKLPISRPKVYQPKKMYGFSLYEDNSITGFVSFNLNDLSTFNLVDEDNLDYVNYSNVTAGAYGDGIYYCWGSNSNMQSTEFYKYDFDARKKTVLSDYYQENVQLIKAYDMSYDYSTQTMYSLVEYNKDNYYEQFLAKINLANGKATDSIRTDKCCALACSYDGKLYGISLSGNLVKIDKTTGKQTVLIETNLVLEENQRQSMEFDHTDGSLYWACYAKDYSSTLIKFNLEDNTFLDLGTPGGNAQLAGLYIPFVRNKLDAPNQATGLVVIENKDGKAEADISWKNPVMTLNEDPLDAISKVELYRNDKLITTQTTVTPGEEMSFHDTKIPNGYNTYKVVAYNTAGDGVPASSTRFVGHDVPQAVINPTLTKVNDTTAKLSWEAPKEGSAGGWISPDIIYNVVRMPDSVVVKNHLTTTEFTETGLIDLKTYYYRIEPETADGKGILSETNHVIIGEACIPPYQTHFEAPDASGLWTVIDANEDESVWTFTSYDIIFGHDVAVTYMGYSSDEWLISSPIRFEKEKEYELFLDGRVYNKDSVHIEITIGKGNTVESQERVVREYIITSAKVWSTMKMKLPEMPAGYYNVGIHLKDSRSEDDMPLSIQISNFRLKETTAVSIHGAVNYENVSQEGVVVALKQGEELVASAKTDIEGKYDIPYIVPGTYTIVVSKVGYATIEEEIVLTDNENINKNFTLKLLNLFKVQGIIMDVRNQPVTGAEIRLDGYHRYKVVTKEDGTFEITGVYEDDNYTLTVYKSKCEQVVREVNVDKDIRLDDIQLTDALLLPTEVRTQTDNTVTTVSWKEPAGKKIFRYDDGNVIGVKGWSTGYYSSIFGMVYRQPADLDKLSWYTHEDGYRDHDTLHVFIFDLDENGDPIADKILYYEEDVHNVPGTWMTYELKEKVHCPNGFYVALSCDGFLSLGCDDGLGEDYPFRKETVCASNDYEQDPFVYVEEVQEYSNNLMLRAEGTPIGAAYERKTEVNRLGRKTLRTINTAATSNENRIIFRPLVSPVKSNEIVKVEAASENVYHPSYNVYRFKVADENVMANWTLLTDTPVDKPEYTDTTFGRLEKGYYKYGVKAVYTGDRMSEACLSEEVGKDVYTTVTLSISTNVAGVNTEGAYVELKSEKQIYSGRTNSTGKAVIEKVLKGNYTLTVSFPNYEDYVDDVDYSQDNAYSATVVLKEKIVTPANLEVNVTDKTDEWLFSWNGFSIFDDFESHEDFAINSEGSAGWSYIDGDGVNPIILGTATSDFVFPGMGEKMAYIVFNPSLTKPSLGGTLPPHSGSRYLACFGLPKPTANDDYIISPEIGNTVDDFYLTFYAQSLTAMQGNDGDKMRIGYSFTGKEKDDFMWLTEEPVSVAADWTKYSYQIPAGTHYVTINCVSENQLVFMMDDIYIGSQPEYAPETSSAGIKNGGHTYEVYLDGNKVATQSVNTYLFTKVSAGKHTAGVKAVYETGSSETAEATFNVLTDIANAEKDVLMIYPNPAKERLYIKGEYVRVKIYTISGSMVGVYDSTPSLDITHLTNGTYIVEIQRESHTTFAKLIVAQ